MKKRNIALYFQVHQPRRLKSVPFFEIGSVSSYFDDALNKDIIERIARDCYVPTNTMLEKLIAEHPDIKVTFSITGTTLDQLSLYAPSALESFRRMAHTGNVDFLAETNYHSLASFMPGDEFEIQILQHVEKINNYLGVRPSVFRNTELIYSDEIGQRISMLGFEGVITDGVSRVLKQRSPNQLFHHPAESNLKILLRHYQLSDDIAFRYMEQGTPLAPQQFLKWIDAMPKRDNLVTLALDYETFGEHHKRDTGIIDFLQQVLIQCSKDERYQLLTATEAVRLEQSSEPLEVPSVISWADQERDESAWLGNEMQRDAFETLLQLEQEVKRSDDEDLLSIWRYLQTSDHFYYMSTKRDSDGHVHSYFSHYPSPYEAFINYMNVMSDFTLTVKAKGISTYQHSSIVEADRRGLNVPTWAMDLPANRPH